MAIWPPPEKGSSSTGGPSAWCQNFRKTWGQNFRNPHLYGMLTSEQLWAGQPFIEEVLSSGGKMQAAYLIIPCYLDYPCEGLRVFAPAIAAGVLNHEWQPAEELEWGGIQPGTPWELVFGRALVELRTPGDAEVVDRALETIGKSLTEALATKPDVIRSETEDAEELLLRIQALIGAP